MTLLATVVETSTRVGSTSSRLRKVKELAACLASFAPAEIAVGVAYLSGALPQGRIGLAWRVLQAAASESTPSATTQLTVEETDRRIAAIANLRGAGSAS